jgi:hypothetical protein
VLWNAWNRPSISALCVDSWQGDTSSLCMDRCQALMRHLGDQVSSKISYLRAKEPMSAWCQHLFGSWQVAFVTNGPWAELACGP